MKDLVVVSLSVTLALLIIFFIKRFSDNKEGWYPTTTYVNTPKTLGVFPTAPNNWWGGNYYYRLNWQPWGYHHPGYYYRRGLNYNSGPFWNAPASQVGVEGLANSSSPYGNPVPLESIRWRGMFGPMLTSIKSPKDYALGQWVRAGTAYTDNPNDFTYLDVYQLNLDPGRDLFSYMVKTNSGQRIPINLQQNHDRLDDGDRFKVQGMEGKGDFVFVEADKYSYVYS
uniref:Uncharacterized protein n=1 Tax=Marseillevirus LCMAC201 TaxID=2506605 RepID=A0A481YW04_9VIRU|nr:MAG: hypothetical protein LCMAC201_02880 [Marseillevirus LCMAC201]